jgi:hypothetical protein
MLLWPEKGRNGLKKVEANMAGSTWFNSPRPQPFPRKSSAVTPLPPSEDDLKKLSYQIDFKNVDEN